MKTRSQNELVFNHLKRYRSITPLEAQADYGIMRLAARVHDLRSVGRKIGSVIVEVKNRHNEPCHVSRYFLEK